MIIYKKTNLESNAMMGFDDMLISFGLSYLAGNIPQIKEWLNNNMELQSVIDSCYSRALKKWSVNEGVRGIEMSRQNLHMEDLKRLLSGESVADSSYTELVKLWLDEMRKEDICRAFILEHKQYLTNLKIDSGFAKLAQMVQTTQENVKSLTYENRRFHQEEIKMLQQLLTQKNNISDDELAKNIENFLEGPISCLISRLHLDTAKNILEQIELSYSSIISQNLNLRLLVTKMLAKSMTFSDPPKCVSLYHKAYLMDVKDESLVEKELLRLYRRKEYEEAFKLYDLLNDDNIYKAAIKVSNANDVEVAYNALPEHLKTNYTLRYEILANINSEIDTSFLFKDKSVKIEDTLTFDSLLSWLYVMTWETVRFGGLLLLTNKHPEVQGYKEAYEVATKFYSFLEKTEVECYFGMVKAHMCYWGLIVDGHESWIEKILTILPDEVKGRETDLVMIQVSMLMMAQRFNEAFNLVASIKDHINTNIANYVIMMSLHANDINYMKWLVSVVREKSIKLDSSSARCIAACVNSHTATDIRELLDEELLTNIKEVFVLRQLCLYFEKKEIDKDTLIRCGDDISDDMLAYAAYILANVNEPQRAFDILSGKVDKDKLTIRLRLFMQVMSRLPEQQPELYELLKKHRKSGLPIDEGWLQMEFSMATRVADFENAYEVIKELYDIYPLDENVYTNYLRMIGRFKPSDLEGHQKKVLSLEIKNFRNVSQIYQLYAENDYLDFAAEFLYIHVRASEDWAEKTFYNNETTTGLINEIVQQKYDTAKEGLYAVCLKNDGSRVIYQIKQGNEIGEQLESHKEGDCIVARIAGEDVQLTIAHIINKYEKLSVDIMRENMEGDNPYMKPFKINMEHPLESIEEALRSFDPDHVNYNERQNRIMEQYERCELGLTHLIGSTNTLGDYYERLFSQDKVFVTPCQLLNRIIALRGESSLRYVLDLPAMLLLFEYQKVSGYIYDEKFIIASSIYEFILANLKNHRRLVSPEFAKALKGNGLVKYNNRLDGDIEIRLSELMKWMDDNCEIEIPSKALSVERMGEKTEAWDLMMNTLTLMMVPGRCLVTEDMLVEKMMRSKANIISTEAYMMRPGKADLNFGKFLSECNYIGIWLPRNYIVGEYIKMEKAIPNKINYIMQNAMYNELLSMSVVTACVTISQKAKDKQLARITITNMLAAMIKSFDVFQRSSMVSEIFYALPDQFQHTLFVKQCLQDATKICNVIIMPKINL